MDLIIILLMALFSLSEANGHFPTGWKSDLVALSQIKDPVDASLEDVRCYNFSLGMPHRQEFYSPGHPANYPPKIDCLLVIKADPGFVIRVDFRDMFDIEPHPQCLYDFLEIRDGAHGYSTLIGRYCGRTFPPVITSSERFLWLRFTTDDNIEYTGFRAVYQFLPDPAPRIPDQGSCRFQVTGLDGIFSRSDVPEEVVNHSKDFMVPLDCTWVITVAETHKIQLSFPSYALMAPNECDLNFIEIFGEMTDLRHRLRLFCGSKIDIVLSKSNILHLRLYAHHTALRSTFEALFTAVTLYRETEGTAKCIASEFDCEDAVCIDSSLRCNGRINCKFRYDEDNCKVVRKKVMSSDHIIVILTIFCVTLFGLCFSCFFNCIRKLRADHSIYQARRSRSREDRLDVFDDTSSKALPHQTPIGFSLTHDKNKSRHQSGRGTATTTDDDMFQQRPRQQTSTSRSLSSPTTPNGFLDSCVSIEPFPGGASAGKAPGERQFTGTLHGLAESSGRDSDEDEDVDDDEDEDEEEVEMVDHACQTRESLFDNKNGDSVVLGPMTDQPSRQSYSKIPTSVTIQPSRVQFPLPSDSRYKAERTIEIAQRTPTAPPLLPSSSATDARIMFSKANTSSSAASSKSGADVVVLH
ncbi:putative Neuropilin and tolloid protein 2 [Daphnia magna]|uniref:Putative Neuropilin and tolloid protein 2 n=1 Tax=Daphnia magna TaxID=35525 RepID=A0A0P5CFB3_9CRUS|nr:putative Neuropilin and tolloid protein 2 [Daphnia magna]